MKKWIAPFKHLSICAPLERLPSELLENIANRLPRRTLNILVRVCRSWNVALTPVLYSSADTLSPQQLDSLIKTLTSTATQKQLGHLIRRLRVWDTLSDSQLQSLTELCPNLVELCGTVCETSNISPYLYAWKYLTATYLTVCLNTPQHFHTGFSKQLLTHLTLTTRGISTWIDLIREFVSLRSLCIEAKGEGDVNDHELDRISFGDLENLQNSLPKLECLAIYLLWVEGEIPLHLIPCHTVRNLIWVAENPGQCIRYISLKYTNLEELYLAETSHLVYTKLTLAPLMKSCSNLKQLVICDNLKLYYLLLDMLASAGAPLTHITFIKCKEDFVAKYLHHFKETLTSVNLRDIDSLYTQSFLSNLHLYTSLTDLAVKCSLELGINSILSSVKALRNLFIQARRIHLVENDRFTLSRHLKELVLIVDDMDDQIYPYLAHYHPSLTRFEISYSDTCNRPCFIYYPHPGLKVLAVNYENSCVFRVLQSHVAEKTTKLCWRLRSEATRNVRWYYWNRLSKKSPPFQRLEISQVQDIADLREDDDKYSLSTEPDQVIIQQKMVFTAFGKPIVFVQCHFVDEMYLNGRDCSYA
ncbi:hypothetical protein EC973_000622 [Apophysomyces ossiformis]|uniref:F-box domain-containing protein n=1 Tax=Apophysomyces ossiformis TaxID=679940 RepID=A0A8H7BYM7_9FUNG|nr:hypothetical protein EC973_000622 [Apophysomyces ossiformis]